MDMMQGFLSLVAFRYSLAQSTAGDLQSFKRLAPAYPAVYGGFYIAFGAEWFRSDFEDHDWFCGKLSAEFNR